MTNECDGKNDGSACGCGGGTGAGKWIWLILGLGIVGVLVAKNTGNTEVPTVATTQVVERTAVPVAMAATNAATPEPATQKSALPRLVDLGAGKCIPCKLMAPILEELKTNYVGKLNVQFIDVWVDPEAGKPYNINMIPTQIFYDSEGKELFRHEGFFGKEDILAKWKELGIELGANVPQK